VVSGSLDSGVGFESGVVGVDMNCGCLEKCGSASISPCPVGECRPGV
jgi:hypothetical protein